MTTPDEREAMQKALDAMVAADEHFCIHDIRSTRLVEAIADLRAALSTRQEAQREAVAWMDPATKDVINAQRKQDWLTHFGDGGKKKAISYTEPLYGRQPDRQESALQSVFLDLLQQVDAFIAEQGEASFYTAPARAMRDVLQGKEPADYLRQGLDRFLRGLAEFDGAAPTQGGEQK